MDPNSPIENDEVILRRVPKQRGMSLDLKSVLPGAFAPMKSDTDGLSVHRAAIHTPKEVARDFRTRGSQPVWVAHLRASEIRAIGCSVEPDPLGATEFLPAQPGHALIPEITAPSAKETVTIERQRRLAAAVFRLDGPFDPPART